MKNWKSSTNPKVHQRAINHVLREVNKGIYDDDLWMGRFFVHQIRRDVLRDRDHLSMVVELRFYDHKTKKYSTEVLTSNEVILWNGSKIWGLMNDFIVDDLDVWRTEDVRNDKQDWRGASKEKTMREATSLWQPI